MHSSPQQTRHRSRRRPGFTLVELLVTIAILALLAGLTVKGISKFRQAAWKADTQNQLTTISTAIQQYYSTFHAYPGPLPTTDLASGITAATMSNSITVVDRTAAGFSKEGNATLTNVTATENLVLGLFGGLENASTTAVPNIRYDPQLLGTGPRGLNYQVPKKYQAFLDDQKMLSWRNDSTGNKSGHYVDDVGSAADSLVPELVDRFPQGMPILFLRANNGAPTAYTNPTPPTNTQNGIVTIARPTAPNQPSQYDLFPILGYTGALSGTWPGVTTSDYPSGGSTPPATSTHSIGEGKYLAKGQQYVKGSTSTASVALYHGLRTVNVAAKLTKGDANYQYPYDAYAYLANPTVADTPRQKDQFILISPGPDRTYGTDDDITSFGSVGGD